MKQVDLNTQLVARSTSRSPSTVGDDPKALARAWRLEMERAQMQDWLSHGAIGMKPAAFLAPGTVTPPAPPVAPASTSDVQPGDSDIDIAAVPPQSSSELEATGGLEPMADVASQVTGDGTSVQPLIGRPVVQGSATAADAGNVTVRWAQSHTTVLPPRTSGTPVAASANLTVASQPTTPDHTPSHPVGYIAQAQAHGTDAMVQSHTSERQVGQQPLAQAAVAPKTHNENPVAAIGPQLSESATVKFAEAATQVPSARPQIQSRHAQAAQLAESLQPFGKFQVTSADVQGRGNMLVALPSAQPASPSFAPHEISVSSVGRLPIETAGKTPGIAPASQNGVPVAWGIAEDFHADGAQRFDTQKQVSLGARSPHVARQPSPSPIRLHADWSEDGVRLWLGMDASAATDLPSITAHLQRWMSAQDVRLLSVVCNGRMVVQDSSHADGDVLDLQAQASDGRRGPATDSLISIHPISEELK